jgi:hypothetical protein
VIDGSVRAARNADVKLDATATSSKIRTALA